MPWAGKDLDVWRDELTSEIVELLSGNEQLSESTAVLTQNWWDDLARSIAEVLGVFMHTLSPADTTAMTKALNDLQAAVTAMQGMHIPPPAVTAAMTKAVNDLQQVTKEG